MDVILIQAGRDVCGPIKNISGPTVSTICGLYKTALVPRLVRWFNNIKKTSHKTVAVWDEHKRFKNTHTCSDFDASARRLQSLGTCWEHYDTTLWLTSLTHWAKYVRVCVCVPEYVYDRGLGEGEGACSFVPGRDLSGGWGRPRKSSYLNGEQEPIIGGGWRWWSA